MQHKVAAAWRDPSDHIIYVCTCGFTSANNEAIRQHMWDWDPEVRDNQWKEWVNN